MKKLLNLLLGTLAVCVFFYMFLCGLEKEAEYEEYKNDRICELYPEANCGGQK